MTRNRSHRAVAFVLSTFITLTIFAGVTSFAEPVQGAAQMAQALVTPQA